MSVLKNRVSNKRKKRKSHHRRQKSSLVKLAIGDLRIIEDDVKLYKHGSRVLRLFSIDNNDDDGVFNPVSPVASPLLSPSVSLRNGSSMKTFSALKRSVKSASNIHNYSRGKRIKRHKQIKYNLLNSDKLPKINTLKSRFEKEKLLIQKIILCCELCDFRKSNDFNDDSNNDNKNNELKKVHNKTILLKEIQNYLSNNDWNNPKIVDSVVHLMHFNLFRSLPDSLIITEFEGIDIPMTYQLSSWEHLQVIYEIGFQGLINESMNASTITLKLMENNNYLLSNIINLFNCLYKFENNYVKIIVHSVYFTYPTLRELIREQLFQYLVNYIYNMNQKNQL